ncbi:MAG: molybdenum cofactor guanylyltransferase [Rhodanobacteraceae bacterium]
MRADADRTLGLVLSGGAGSRVGGKDKGLQSLLGRPLVGHMLAALRLQCDALVVSANRNIDAYAGYAPTIHDENPTHLGPLGGLIVTFGFLAANRHASFQWLLTAPVDCPDPPCDLALRLHAALTTHTDSVCAYMRHAGVAQPLFALYRIENDIEGLRASAQSALDVHGSPMHWHKSLNALAVDFNADESAFHNLNTPAEFAEYERTHAGS